MIFSFFFSRKLRYKKNNRTSISQLYSGVLSRYIHRLQIWRSIMTAQIFFCSRYGVFYVFFMFFFSKKIRNKKITELEILKLIVRCCQAKFRGCKSGVQVWLLKSFWFSRNCVFCVFFFFIFFSKFFFQKLQFLNPIVGCC